MVVAGEHERCAELLERDVDELVAQIIELVVPIAGRTTSGRRLRALAGAPLPAQPVSHPSPRAGGP